MFPGVKTDVTKLPAKMDHKPATTRVVLLFYVVMLAVVTQLPGLAIDRQIALVVQVDKIFYFLAYAVLMGLTVGARLLGWQRSGYSNRLVALIVVLVVAMVDHGMQARFGPSASSAQKAELVARVLGILSVYLVAASPTGLTRWPVHLTTVARVIWLPLLPTVVMLAVMPRIHKLYQFVGLDPIAMGRGGADKTGHFYLGMALTWLFAIAVPATRRRPRLSVAVTIGFMLLSAPLAEVLQSYTGRGVEIADVTAHNNGVLVAMVVWAGLVLFVAPIWNGFLDRRGVGRIPIAAPLERTED
jgi:hypothetical protein